MRRGFHTLKGSGRMVGLIELGDYAYDVEKVFNRLLEEERPVTRAVLALIDVAQTSFRELGRRARRSDGRVTADPRPLHAAIAAVERELPGSPAPRPRSRRRRTSSNCRVRRAALHASSTGPESPAPSHWRRRHSS